MSKRLLATLVLLGLVLAAVFIYRVSNPPTNDFVIKMTRVTCRGNCPAYTLIISSDGTVSYSGGLSVKKEGKFTSTLTPEQIAILLHEIKQSKIFGSNAGCCIEDVTDAPGVILEVTLNGKTTRAAYAIWDRGEAPQELRHLECMVDEIANSVQWTGWNRRFCQEILK